LEHLLHLIDFLLIILGLLGQMILNGLVLGLSHRGPSLQVCPFFFQSGHQYFKLLDFCLQLFDVAVGFAL